MNIFIMQIFTKLAKYIKKKKWIIDTIKRYFKEIEIKNYFLSIKRDTNDPVLIEIADFFQNHKFSVYPYDFIDHYIASNIYVYRDDNCKMRYVMHEDKRLYFPQYWSIKTIQNYYNRLCIEQDKASPHQYEADEFTVQQGNIIADIGAAEGIWSLGYVEKAEKIYIFECNQKWQKALEKTFEPWKEKVVIVRKYVSNTDDDHNITLDSFFYSKKIDFIKADIEGME